ncbi:SDR family oxidoreductase [Variovorax paradoxus]|nr:SDR family oxidoreductase [Variovorax paradoxus]
MPGKACLITAAASGIGRAGCELFAREGARVVAVDCDAARLHYVVAGIRATGGEARGVVADLLDPAACQRAAQEAASLLGGIDVVWNHAGMSSTRTLDALDLDDYGRCMDLNVRSAMVVTAAALPYLRRQGGGSVVLTASVAGLIGLPESPAYNAAKAAVLGLMRSLAIRHARDGIRVNAVCPGPIDTPMLQGYLGTSEGDEGKARLRRALAPVPMRRLGRPEEVAHAALWLASGDASYVTGVALPVDGGYVAG